MELESGDAENVTDSFADERKMVSESADVEGSEGLEDEATNLDEQVEDLEERGRYLKEQGENVHEREDLKKDGDIPGDTTGEMSLQEETEVPEGCARSSSVLVIGEDNKFYVRSRYLSDPISSCHDLCKSGYKEQEPEKKIRRPFLGKTRESRPFTRSRSDILVRPVSGSLRGEKDPLTTSKKAYYGSDFSHLKLKRTQSEIKLSSAVSPILVNRNESQSGKKIMARSSSLLGNVSSKVKEIKTGPKKETVRREKEKEEEKAKEPMNTLSLQTPLKKSYKNVTSISHAKKPSVCNESSRFGPNNNKKSVNKASKIAPSNEGSPSTTQRPQVRKNKDSKHNQTESQNALSSSVLPSEPAPTPSIEEKPSQIKLKTQQKSESTGRKVVRKIKSEEGSRTNSPRRLSSADSRMISKRRDSLPGERDSSAWNLRFKRGTAVSLQSSNSNPKQLKFKRGKVVDGDGNDEGGIACKLNHISDTDNEPNDNEPEPEKVQLRHQKGLSKKDNVDINNVIKETATKLAKTRKSKVKGLVGAFESLISISDQEPAMEAGPS